MYQKELQIAIRAVKASEPTFRKYFGTKTRVQKKGGNYRNLVSYADKKIEREIKTYLQKAFPNYGFIGEEQGNYNAEAEFVWVSDPIDGTTNYLQGLPQCAISLALLKNGKPVVGVVSAPILNKIYTAAFKKKASCNGKEIHVSRTREVKMTFGSAGWGRDAKFGAKLIPKILPKIRKLRIFAASSLNLCYVAEGSLDFYLAGHMLLWDYAGAQIILEEAGGIFINSKKPQLQIAANKILAKKLLTLLSSQT